MRFFELINVCWQWRELSLGSSDLATYSNIPEPRETGLGWELTDNRTDLASCPRVSPCLPGRGEAGPGGWRGQWAAPGVSPPGRWPRTRPSWRPDHWTSAACHTQSRGWPGGGCPAPSVRRCSAELGWSRRPESWVKMLSLFCCVGSKYFFILSDWLG